MDSDFSDREERDELWRSLGPLRPEIEKVARGELAGTERELQLVMLLARVVGAEMEFRSREESKIN